MKLIIREYLASLREREELDAILPVLVSELGYTVFSSPQRGTRQHGVDVAAVGDHNGERKVFLFTIKKGDLTRQDWNGDVQAVRPSLEEIEDVYIPTKIPPGYKDLKVVIVICFGGEVREAVRAELTGYTTRKTTDTLSFEEWNGDVLASHLLAGVLREEVLPKAWRSSFQKAVALLDEPDASYRHFATLLRQMDISASAPAKDRVRAARQIYLSLWIMYVWARDVGNLEAPYRASELAVLHAWELVKPEIGASTEAGEALATVLVQLINVHQSIASGLIDEKITPLASSRHALSVAVGSRNPVDVNLKLFEALGRLAMLGMWHAWSAGIGDEAHKEKSMKAAQERFDKGVAMIRSNPHLLLPVCDSQATDVALFLVLWLTAGGDRAGVVYWLTSMAQRLNFGVRTRSAYPITSNDYRDLLLHPKDKSDEYFKQNTAGSTLIPLLTAWLSGMAEAEASDALGKLAREKLEHCTMQLWLPDESSDQHLYLNTSTHGRGLTDLDVADGSGLISTIAAAVDEKRDCTALSAFQTGNWPIILLACRHWRLPVPPDFWISALSPDAADNPTDGAPDEDAS
ncbi:MAG: hypothetical protein Q8R02_08785 [Hyphomonadaceae bacterium]|nr:hypothetical protein [Hyphomonadaceae bacterium]